MKMYIVDAFTDMMYRGNPAAVCLLDTVMSDEWMQKVANEMNLSETAFILRTENDYNLRWFTPIAEVDLCGHATLASAHILWEEKIYLNDLIRFQTKSGEITAVKMNNWIQMNFPLESASECTQPTELAEGLGVRFLFVGRNRLEYIVEVESEDILKNLEPRFNVLQKLDARGVIVTSKSVNKNYDFASRCFYPALGVNEDPVTGSAHCCLGPYWGSKLNKSELNAIQLSRRQGVLALVLSETRIIISGKAVTTLRGELITNN
jgi:PhzF family phenazine biosynthesis protein